MNDPIINPFDEDEKSGRQPIVWAILGIAAMGCGLLFAVAFFWFKPDVQSLYDLYFPSPTATSTLTPLPTATITPTPTNTPSPTPNMTAQAYESTAVYASTEWRDYEAETFDDNTAAWYVGKDDDAYAKIAYVVEDGKYKWDATAHQGFVQRMRVNPLSIGDFFFSLEVDQPGSVTGVDYGMVFRENSSGEYYYFSINNDGQFGLWLYAGNEWTQLIDFTASGAILPNAANKLAVLAQGDHFSFFINDQYVAEINNSALKTGRVGMAVEVSTNDTQAVFEFDNILVKLPK